MWTNSCALWFSYHKFKMVSKCLVNEKCMILLFMMSVQLSDFSVLSARKEWNQRYSCRRDYYLSARFYRFPWARPCKFAPFFILIYDHMLYVENLAKKNVGNCPSNSGWLCVWLASITHLLKSFVLKGNADIQNSEIKFWRFSKYLFSQYYFLHSQTIQIIQNI